MNKKLYLLPLLLLALVFASCEETKEVGRYDNWKVRNEMYMDSIVNVYSEQTAQTLPADSIYRLVDQYNQGYIYYKKNLDYKADQPEVSPLYTDSVDTYYRLSYINGEVQQETFAGRNPDSQFDHMVGFRVNQVVAGWTWTLQEMKQGERWTLYIPAASGYGSGTGPQNDLQPYSTLVYDVMLVKVIK